MKEYVTIKMKETEAEEMEKWIRNCIKTSEILKSPEKTIKKFEKFKKIISKREPAED